METIENPIRQLARANNLSTHEIARLTGMSQPSVSRHITEIQSISPRNRQRYIEAFGWIKELDLVKWNKYLRKKYLRKKRRMEKKNGDGQAQDA